jgi:hypothetical protein
VRDLGVSRDGADEAQAEQASLDPAPVDDWSEHIHASALRLLGGKAACGCDAAGGPHSEGVP